MCIPYNITKPTKITHPSDKARKDFIMDTVFINVGISVFHVAINEKNVCGEIRTLHKNKNHKLYSKFRKILDKLTSRRDRILNMIDYRDLRAIEAKVEKSIVKFIDYVSNTDKVVNLELLAVAFIDAGIDRKRKAKPYKIVQDFQDSEMLYGGICENMELKGIRPKHEYDIAELFVSKVKY